MSLVRIGSSLPFESAFDAAFDDLVRSAFGGSRVSSWTPAADVARRGEDVVISIDLPGVSAEDVELEVKDRTLLVSGTRRNLDADGAVLRQEVRRGEFSRAFRLPAHVSADAVSAAYDSGVLTITVNAVAPQPQSARIRIDGLAAPAVESTSGE